MIGFITIVRNIENPFFIFQAEIKLFQIKMNFFHDHSCYKYLKIPFIFFKKKLKYFKNISINMEIKKILGFNLII
jgi:hypothetical protein